MQLLNKHFMSLSKLVGMIPEMATLARLRLLTGTYEVWVCAGCVYVGHFCVESVARMRCVPHTHPCCIPQPLLHFVCALFAFSVDPPDLRAHSLQFVTTLFRENADAVTNEINEAGLQKCMGLLLGEEGSQELSKGLCNRCGWGWQRPRALCWVCVWVKGRELS
jgi:hypothetical protein